MWKILILILFLIATPVSAEKLQMSNEVFSNDPMENHIIQRMDYYTRLFIKLGVPYVWGGNFGILGMDCSGGIETVLRYSGVGHFPRVSAYDMWLTWYLKKKWTKNEDIWDNMKFPRVIWFTFPPAKGKKIRYFGHVAWSRGKTKNGEMSIAEASSSAKYFKETIRPKGSVHDKSLVGLGELNLLPGRK